MIWSDADIYEEIRIGNLNIEPFNVLALQPASIDVRLSRHFMKLTPGRILDPTLPVETHKVEGATYPIAPGEFILGATTEKISLGQGVVARIEGKSSLGRIGLTVHSTAGFVDPGFSGYLTLEIYNMSPRSILLRAGMWIAQIAFESTRTPCKQGYQGRYRDQTQPAPVGSRIEKDSGVSSVEADFYQKNPHLR